MVFWMSSEAIWALQALSIWACTSAEAIFSSTMAFTWSSGSDLAASTIFWRAAAVTCLRTSACTAAAT